jgi:hypothetical protein
LLWHLIFPNINSQEEFVLDFSICFIFWLEDQYLDGQT